LVWSRRCVVVSPSRFGFAGLKWIVFLVLSRYTQRVQEPKKVPPVPIGVEGSIVTNTEAGAFEAMLLHHQDLESQVTKRVEALLMTVKTEGRYESVTAELLAYLAEQVLPHAIAEEHSIYEAAGSLPNLRETVAEMTAEHRELAASVEALGRSSDPADIAVLAESIRLLFTTHVAKENELLLPALRTDATVSLSRMLAQMHGLTEAAQTDTLSTEDNAAPDTEADLLALLLESGDLLAESGRGEEACRLVARAWVTLRTPRPELAVRVTTALHRLIRSVRAVPIELSTRRSTGKTDDNDILDVRPLAPAQRHEAIFSTFDALAPGKDFLLLNDHDPRPLRYQFEAEHAGEFIWDYLEAGPRVWRVRIGRSVGTTG
jgi:uncharacterized protein (DUF2249 family)